MNTSHPSIALALSCGGWRGLSYIGVIKTLSKHNIPIDIITGSSAGALVGGLYAASQDIEKVQSFFLNLNHRDLLETFADITFISGLLKGRKPLRLIKSIIGNINIEDLPITFAAQTTDILSGKPHLITSGNLAQAIRASGSVPFLFSPVVINNRPVVDGGASVPIPVNEAYHLGADIVIAVNPYTNLFSCLKDKTTSHLKAREILKLSYYSMMARLAAHDAAKADIVIEPQIEEGKFRIIRNFINNPQIIEDGAIATQAKIQQIKSIIAKFHEI